MILNRCVTKPIMKKIKGNVDLGKIWRNIRDVERF